jgi:hypothetical protein
MRLAAVLLAALVTLPTAAAADPVGPPAPGVAAAPEPVPTKGVYFSEGLGGGAFHDQLSSYSDSSFRVRLALGFRHGNWAVETFLAPEFGFQSGLNGDGPVLLGYGVDVKRLIPVSRHVSFYARGSMSRLTIEDDPQPCCVLYPSGGALYYAPGLTGYSGRGLGFGVGAQISGKVSALGLLFWPLLFSDHGPKIDAGLFLEDGYDFYRLHRDGDQSIDAGVTRWTMGVALGTAF